MISHSQSVNRNFLLKRDLPMNPDGVRHVEQLKRIKTLVETATAAVVFKADEPNAKCTRRYVTLVEPTQRFLFNPVAINPFIAGIVISRAANSTKIKNLKSPAFNAGDFL